MSTSPAIGSRIKRLRAKLNLTQVDFAKNIGVKGGVVSAWENGTAPVPYGRVLIICEAYHVSERWLQHGVGDMMVSEHRTGNAARDNALEFFLRILDRTTPDARRDALDFMRDVVARYDRLQKDEGEDPSVNFANESDVKIYSADDDFDDEDEEEDDGDEYEYEDEDEYDE